MRGSIRSIIRTISVFACAVFMGTMFCAPVMANGGIFTEYPSTPGSVESVSSADAYNTFMGFSGIKIQGQVDFERDMDLAGISRTWTFTDVNGTVTNSKIILRQNLIAEQGETITVVPELSTGKDSVDTNMDSITTRYEKVIEFRNPNYYPLASTINRIFILDQTAQSEGWRLEPHVTAYNGVDKVEYINIVYSEDNADSPTEDVTSDDITPIDDGGGSGGCNAGMPAGMLAVIAASAFMFRSRRR